MILCDYLKCSLGLPLSHEEHDNLNSKELVLLAEGTLTANAEFLKNLDKMSREEKGRGTWNGHRYYSGSMFYDSLV
jgi:hypothetical protein